MDFSIILAEKGFKENGFKTYIFEKKVSGGIIRIYNLKYPHTTPNWITIEFQQKGNRFTKFNGIINTLDSFETITSVILQQYE